MFFDGVPDPSKAPIASQISNQKTNAPDATLQALAKEAFGSVHEPYLKKQCQKCHESRYAEKLLTTAAMVCFDCHVKMKAPARYEHAPFASGECLTCHDPHQSSEKYLLKRAGQSLCYECHLSTELGQAKEHQNMGTTYCTVCHDPHKGEKYFLKATAQISAPPAPGIEKAP
jgi:predicted CXXCH cytochrome family protein